MDLQENIKNGAKMYSDREEHQNSFIRGATSNQAKDYWYAQYESERNLGLEGIKELLSSFKTINHFEPHVSNGKESLHNQIKHNLGIDYLCNEPIVMQDFEKYKEYMRDCPDPSFTFEDWKNMMTKYNQVTRKIVDEIAESVLGVSGHPIDIVLSEKWYRPNIFDNIDICDNKEKQGEINYMLSVSDLSIIKAFDKYKGKVAIIGVPNMPNIGKGLRMDPITFKEMSIGITEQIKDVEPFVMHNIHKNDIVPPIDSYEKPWDTKKQKRNNYKKKRRK